MMKRRERQKEKNNNLSQALNNSCDVFSVRFFSGEFDPKYSVSVCVLCAELKFDYLFRLFPILKKRRRKTDVFDPVNRSVYMIISSHDEKIFSVFFFLRKIQPLKYTIIIIFFFFSKIVLFPDRNIAGNEFIPIVSLD